MPSTPSPDGRIYWSELNTWDPEKAKAYYGAVLGWRFQETRTAGTDAGPPYWIALKDGQPVAGIFTLTEPMFKGVPDHWFTSIAVADLKAAIAASAAAGGQVMREPFEIPGFGTFCVIEDATGAALGLIEPAARSEG